MEYSLLKEKVLSVVQEADSDLLERIYSLAMENEEDAPGEFSEVEIEWLEKQTEQVLSGSMTMSPWSEVKARILAKRNLLIKGGVNY